MVGVGDLDLQRLCGGVSGGVPAVTHMQGWSRSFNLVASDDSRASSIRARRWEWRSATPRLGSASRVVHVVRRPAHRARLIQRNPAFGRFLVLVSAPLVLVWFRRCDLADASSPRARAAAHDDAAPAIGSETVRPLHPGVALDSRRAQAHPMCREERLRSVPWIGGRGKSWMPLSVPLAAATMA